ncbi:hypothetical protein MCP_1670 [Methanocella paludicola SANAE]|uniref:Uncharacterized protein n=1 Tax=Methanocella paludicola (strain DSM 17711 / JCM 13418 / NBRC 101707 / SANAE) TaxID=304371 RepID=D1YZ70_METPS|nr:hypothetical protein [Methanocella paludicola]BAI61742.1 hypothetical protein MCP_1670 [Methanocella paludicola SANAE]
MGILDDFIKTIKGQRSQYKAEQRQAEMEKIARENEAKAKAAREREWAARENEAKLKAQREREYMGQSKTSDKGYVGEVVDRIKEQRREFEEAQKAGAPKKPETERGPIDEFAYRIKEQRREFEEASKGPKPAAKHAPTQTIQEQKPETIKAYGHTFMYMPGQTPHILFDEPGKSVYIDNVDEYLKAGGKVEQREITAAMDPQMYNIYTSKGGPIGQARYYKSGDIVISLVPDPFKNYR